MTAVLCADNVADGGECLCEGEEFWVPSTGGGWSSGIGGSVEAAAGRELKRIFLPLKGVWCVECVSNSVAESWAKKKGGRGEAEGGHPGLSPVKQVLWLEAESVSGGSGRRNRLIGEGCDYEIPDEIVNLL